MHAPTHTQTIGKSWVAIHTSDKIDFKTKSVTKDKEEHYITIKESIQGEVLQLLTFMNILQEHLNI